jgi:hypothetical protein
MHDTTTAPSAPTEPAERRCWRCLRMFPGDTDALGPGGDEFWLCDPCAAILLPAKRPSR